MRGLLLLSKRRAAFEMVGIPVVERLGDIPLLLKRRV